MIITITQIYYNTLMYNINNDNDNNTTHLCAPPGFIITRYDTNTIDPPRPGADELPSDGYVAGTAIASSGI